MFIFDSKRMSVEELVAERTRYIKKFYPHGLHISGLYPSEESDPVIRMANQVIKECEQQQKQREIDILMRAD